MEITKFRLQLATALQQVTVLLWQVRYRFRRLKRIAARRARRLGHELRTRKNALPMLLAAKPREAIAEAGSKVAKGKDRVSMVCQKGAARLRQVRNRLGQARNSFARLQRSIAKKVQKVAEECCAREDELRALLAAKFREALVGASSKISKGKAQISVALKQGTARLRQVRNSLGQVRNKLGQAQNGLKGMTRSIAEKRQKRAEERRARKEELLVKMARPPKEVVEADHKVTKTKAQLSIVPGQWTAHLLEAQNPLAGLARSVAEEPQKEPEGLRAREEELRVKVARSQETSVEADSKVTTARGQAPGAPAALEQWAAHFQQAQNAVAGRTRSMAEKPQKAAEERRARVDELRAQVARPREAVVAGDNKSAKVETQLSIAPEKGAAPLRRVRKTLSGLGRDIVDRRRRKRQELGARESQMHELLASSQDAIVVISGDHRLVTANRRALDLFGVSERNLSKFNIDAFLFRGQIPDLHGNGSFFKGRQERHGKCTIRRLDGSLRVAEIAFVADFLPLHLYRFYDLCMPQWPTPIHHRIGHGTQQGSQGG